MKVMKMSKKATKKTEDPPKKLVCEIHVTGGHSTHGGHSIHGGHSTHGGHSKHGGHSIHGE